MRGGIGRRGQTVRRKTPLIEGGESDVKAALHVMRQRRNGQTNLQVPPAGQPIQ